MKNVIKIFCGFLIWLMWIYIIGLVGLCVSYAISNNMYVLIFTLWQSIGVTILILLYKDGSESKLDKNFINKYGFRNGKWICYDERMVKSLSKCGIYHKSMCTIEGDNKIRFEYDGDERLYCFLSHNPFPKNNREAEDEAINRIMKFSEQEYLGFKIAIQDEVKKAKQEIDNYIAESNDYEIRIEPIEYDYSNAILQGDTVEYSVHLYRGKNKINCKFEISVATTMDDSHYKFSIVNGNKFKVFNKKLCKNRRLFVSCETSIGNYPNEEYFSQVYEIMLCGNWFEN